MKQNLTELERETDTSTIIEFKTSLSIMEKTSRQQINKETEYLQSSINQLVLTDIYRTSH